MIVIRSPRLRRFLRYALPWVFMPLLVILGAAVMDEKRHLIISFGMAVMALLLFLSGFEKKKTGSRRLVIVSVMTALCIVGRFIPFFKPITALTVITAMYLGSESGFLVGSMAALLSNFYFGQGPWTPFQMLAWGLIGLLSGAASSLLKKSRILLLLWGVASGLVYSLIMDAWTVIWYNSGFNWSLYLTALTAALPHALLYSVSNFFFLLYLAKPFGEKLERVRLKYGI